MDTHIIPHARKKKPKTPSAYTNKNHLHLRAARASKPAGRSQQIPKRGMRVAQVRDIELIVLTDLAVKAVLPAIDGPQPEEQGQAEREDAAREGAADGTAADEEWSVLAREDGAAEEGGRLAEDGEDRETGAPFAFAAVVV